MMKDYFDALDRLLKGCPRNLPKETRITNDAVAIEAGRKKGSIKRSRPVFAALIRAIEQANSETKQPTDILKNRLDKAKFSAENYRVLWEEAIAREISLLHELFSLKQELSRLVDKERHTGGAVERRPTKVLRIRP